MPRLTGPLFSLDARQTLGKTIVYSAWKGLNYARMRVIPYNPKSDYQVGIRDVVSKAAFYFTKGPYVTDAMKTWWDIYAEGTNMSGWNRFMKFFVALNYDSVNGIYTYAGVPDPQ